jgi:hypothetical protein
LNTLSTFLRYESWFLIVGLLLIVAYQLLTGRINTDGLLYEKGEKSQFSPGRLQLLVMTVGIAFYYFLQVLEQPEPKKFPELPGTLLLILAGSNLFYLGSKLSSLLGEKLNSLLPRLQAGSQIQNKTNEKSNTE